MNTFARAAIASAVVALTAGSARAQILEQILVKVNGEIFTKTDLEQRQILLLRQRGEVLDPRSGNEQLQKLLNDITPQLMVDVVDEMLIMQRGRELGYRLTDEQFTQAIESIKKENNIPSDEALDAALKQENMTLADLRENFEKQAVIARVEQNEVFGKVGVTESEARAYYDSHVGEFTTPPSITLREILVKAGNDPDTINVADDEAARERMEGIRGRLAAGESFEALAAQVSDAPSRANAGLIGPLQLDDLSPELRRMIEALKVGEVTDVVRSSRGYQILKLESSTPAEIMPFEKARELIGERVFTSKRVQEFEKYKQTLRDQAIIEWENAEVQKAYEAGLKMAAAPPAL
jgi:peptidyl-prolyl cis-trans isomerase SurA